MGKRRQDLDNIENISPLHGQNAYSITTDYTQHPEQHNMKTRSAKSRPDHDTEEVSASSYEADNTTTVYSQQFANSASISVVEIDSAMHFQDDANTTSNSVVEIDSATHFHDNANAVSTSVVETDTAVHFQDVSNSASTSVVEIEVPFEFVEASSKSPLAESSHNEQMTPEKETLVAAEKLFYGSPLATSATPTANLKILCEAVDHDESISSETRSIRILRGDEPVTPTTNLKMLITAASPEIRSLELSKSRLFTDEDDDDDTFDDISVSGKSASATRKQKSLGILCRRFMAQFDENPPQTSRIEVCLDELASHLGTERRRIYDIVNVLESVEIMSRRAKNRYLWHGKTNLSTTLVKLKYFAETEKVAKQLELVRELEVTRLYGRKNNLSGGLQSEEEAVAEHPKYKEFLKLFGDAHRKERSLGVMSQKFIMLFLTGKTKTINLDMAAKILMGDPLVETKQINSQFKTKIRRLYDIANILASIGLICKVHVTELRGRKPAFSYIGPDVDQLSTLDEYKYLKNVDVIRPGRTTLDMKMEELKKKMEAHIALEQAEAMVRQVPPVNVQAPDLEEIKMMASGSGTNLSQAAGEHAAKKERSVVNRTLMPKAPAQPFVVIHQGVTGGPASVVSTSQAPTFMDVSNTSQDPFTGVTLLPLFKADGNQYVVATNAGQQIKTPVSVSLGGNSLSTTSPRARRILPQPGTSQTLTLYTPPTTKPAVDEPANSQKRTISQALDLSGCSGGFVQGPDVQGPDGTFSTFFLTKSQNEYFLTSKKAKTDEEPSTEQPQPADDVGLQPAAVVEVVLSAEPSTDHLAEAFETPDAAHMSPVPTVVYSSTPSGLHTAIPGGAGDKVGAKGVHGITGTQISFLASPVVTPVGTPLLQSAGQASIDKEPAAAREIHLQ